MALRDRLDRPLKDLRISVTDRCNLRCTYCMPSEVFGPDYAFLQRDELLTYEEIIRLARLFVERGVKKIRITGGEPLLRRELPQLIHGLSQLAGLKDLTLTTNGLLLASQAGALRDAGLHRVTVSLDSLDPEVFAQMNGRGVDLKRVLGGIEAAQAAGLTPIKVNCVVQRGVNDQGLLPLVDHFRGSGIILRFIEYMDVGNSNGWKLDQVVAGHHMLEEIGQKHPIEPLNARYPGEVARRWRFLDGQGEIGLIKSVSAPFCQACTRARLSSEGRLYTCLFASSGFDLRDPLRSGAGDQQILSMLDEIWLSREDRYSEIRSRETTDWPRVEMSRIGG